MPKQNGILRILGQNVRKAREAKTITQEKPVKNLRSLEFHNAPNNQLLSQNTQAIGCGLKNPLAEPK